MAAPTPEAAIVLWPQPWPRPGSASYSARIADARTVVAEPAGPHGPDRGREAARRMLDGEPVPLEDLGHPCRGPHLLERRLGVGVDPVRQVDDLDPGGVDGAGEPGFRVAERLGGLDVGQGWQTVLLSAGRGWERHQPSARAEGRVSVPRRGLPRRRRSARR